MSAPRVFENETLDRIAKSRDVGVAEVVLAWLRSQDQVIAIPKTTSKDHLKSNLKRIISCTANTIV